MEQGERINTLVCIFDMQSPKISAYNIHEWVHSHLKLEEDQLRMLQIDGSRRRVYIKLVSSGKLQSILQDTGGHLTYNHNNGEVSTVTIEKAGMGVRRVRVANLPPEIKKSFVRDALIKYGEVKGIQEENWTRQYRYAVSNGIRLVEMQFNSHVTSHLMIAGHRALISYDGQPSTCYNCNEQGHMYGDCPYRQQHATMRTPTRANTWSHIVKQRPTLHCTPVEEHTTPMKPGAALQTTDTQNIPIDEANNTVSPLSLIRGDDQREDRDHSEGERLNTQHTLEVEEEDATKQHGNEAGHTPHLNRVTKTGREGALKWCDDMEPDDSCDSNRGEGTREPV
jgi:hypothetical protein